MTTSEIAQIISSCAVAFTFLLLFLQLKQNRKDRLHDVYERINSQWVQHMARVLSDPQLECIWEKISDDRKQELDSADDALGSSAWKVMNDKEKKCYRYVRISLEIFEIAYQFTQNNSRISKQIIKKWEGQILVFLGSDYFMYVFDDTKPRLDEQFTIYVDTLIKKVKEHKKATEF